MSLKRVTHVTASVSTLGGGIPEALSALASAQVSLSLEVNAIGHLDAGTKIPKWTGHHLSALPAKAVPQITWAPKMRKALIEQSPSLIHTHGLWTQASITACRFATSHRVPYLVSPHGMLDEWALSRSRLKKRVAARLFENRHLKNASCLHALCHSEAQSFRNYGIKGPVAVVPNGVDLPDDHLRDNHLRDGRKTLLFLGRIHPKKGLANAIHAFAKAGIAQDWQFVIAGWDQNHHLRELKQLCGEQKISTREIPLDQFLADEETSGDVLFVGPAFNKQKSHLLRRADASILPSFSEGMPMSVLEAWSYRLPVIMTRHCNLPEGFDAGAAVKTGTDVKEITKALLEFVDRDKDAQAEMGLSGRRLVEKNFTWTKIAADMIEVYKWILGEETKPSCVIGDKNR